MIEILLSSYNGARWIDQQIESIANQNCVDWLLTVRDDGSSDDTVQRLQAWKYKLGDKMRILPSEGNVGVVRSFEILLEQSIGEYVMMCDQDDVWLPEKVQVTYERMLEVEAKNPGKAVLVFTSVELVDGELRPLGTTFFQQNRFDFPFALEFNNICVCNCIAGCTAMINREAVRLSLPFGKHSPYHDWWIAARVSKHGILSVIEEPMMLYRQHGDNACGMKQTDPHHYVSLLRHPIKAHREFSVLEPFLREVGFGGMPKFYICKIRHYIHRKLR